MDGGLAFPPIRPRGCSLGKREPHPHAGGVLGSGLGSLCCSCRGKAGTRPMNMPEKWPWGPSKHPRLARRAPPLQSVETRVPLAFPTCGRWAARSCFPHILPSGLCTESFFSLDEVQGLFQGHIAP